MQVVTSRGDGGGGRGLDVQDEFVLGLAEHDDAKSEHGEGPDGAQRDDFGSGALVP